MKKTLKQKLLEEIINTTRNKLISTETSVTIAKSFDLDSYDDKYLTLSQKEEELGKQKFEYDKLFNKLNKLKCLDLGSSDFRKSILLYEIEPPLNGNNYLALNSIVGGDICEIDNNSIYFITPTTTVGKELIKLEEGEEIVINNLDYLIKSIK